MTNSSLLRNVVGACWVSARSSCISAIIIKSTRPTSCFFARCILNALSLPFRVLLYGGISLLSRASFSAWVIASSIPPSVFCSTETRIFGSFKAG